MTKIFRLLKLLRGEKSLAHNGTQIGLVFRRVDNEKFKKMEKPKRGSFTFSTGMCRGILREEAYNKAMAEYRHWKISQRYSPYQIYHKGEFVEEIRFLYKKDAWEYIRENLLIKGNNKFKLKDFKVFGFPSKDESKPKN